MKSLIRNVSCDDANVKPLNPYIMKPDIFIKDGKAMVILSKQQVALIYDAVRLLQRVCTSQATFNTTPEQARELLDLENAFFWNDIDIIK